MAGFSIPLAQLAEKMKSDLDTVVRKSTAQVFGAVVLKTAVDTGRARANWVASEGAPNTTTTESTDQSRGLVEANKALNFAVGGVTYLSNSLAYIRPLEYGTYPNPPKKPTGKTVGGYSKQSPQGMVRISAIEFSGYVQKVINEK